MTSLPLSIIYKSPNNVTEERKGFVDTPSFFQLQPLRLSALLSFGTGQIDKIKPSKPQT